MDEKALKTLKKELYKRGKLKKLIKKRKTPVYTLTIAKKEPTTIKGYFTDAVEEEKRSFFFR